MLNEQFIFTLTFVSFMHFLIILHGLAQCINFMFSNSKICVTFLNNWNYVCNKIKL